jgi:hypothetical protein
VIKMLKQKNTKKQGDVGVVDYIFVLTDDGTKYLIPSDLCGNSLSLGDKYKEYKLDG